MKTVYDLMVNTAARLAGRPVRISQTPPPYVDREGKTTRGCCYRDSAGVVVIHVLAGIDEDAFKNFLHEVSHAKLHFDQLPELNNPAPRSVVVPATAYTTPAFLTREAEVNDQVNRWLAIARRNSKAFVGSEFTTMLLSLARWASIEE